MDDNDPFNSDEDSDRTIVRPNPGGRRGASRLQPSAAAPSPRPPAGAAAARAPASKGSMFGGQPRDDISTTGPNVLIAAAAPLIALGSSLRFLPELNEIQELRTRIAGELKRFKEAAGASGADDETIRLAHYTLCAFIDDIVQNTIWGTASSWSQRNLVSAYHNDVTAGERLFEICERLNRSPDRFPDVLELIYVVISLGFEGRYRIDPHGTTLLGRIRDALYGSLRKRRPQIERGLSPRWQGSGTGQKPLLRRIPVWVYWSALAGLGAILYSAFLYGLNSKSDEALASVWQTVPPVQTLARTVEPAAPPTPEVDVFPELAAILSPDTQAGRLRIVDRPGEILIVMRNTGLFASGAAEIPASYSATLARMANAIDLTEGPVSITGHTDNIPIRSLRFPSNWDLSRERAQSVGDALGQSINDASRLNIRAMGDSNPISDNGTAEGRRENRRVEVVLQKKLTWN